MSEFLLVPVEPTKEMRGAIFGLLSAYDDGSDITPSFFMKMLLNAAPKPPEFISEPELVAYHCIDEYGQKKVLLPGAEGITRHIQRGSVLKQLTYMDTACRLLAERDALATQRDEGLAREAELHNMLERHDASAQTLHEVIGKLRGERDALQQRLAEAEKLFEAMEILQWDENWTPAVDVAVRASRFLASPGYADGEKAEPPAPEKYDDVLAPFLGLMTRELHANAAKGDRQAWLQMTPEQCLLEIYYHVSKLQKAVRDSDRARVAENTADVANMAMMMADIFSLLTEPVDQEQPS